VTDVANSAELTGETVELLQQLIRHQCVNDSTPESGQEVQSARLLRDELEGLALDVELFEPAPGRMSLVARYDGTDASAPALCLMAHTDVVPVSPDGWLNDPFGGEMITSPDGVDEVWGRGAVDMLNLTSSMLVAFREIVRSGKRYPGDIIYFAVADEEAGSRLGAKYVVDNHWDAVRCEYVVTEYGGTPAHGPSGTSVLLTNAQKSISLRRIVVHGTPGHGSMPYATDNALVKAAEITRRLTEAELAPQIDEMFRDRVMALGLEPHMEAGLLDPGRIADTLAQLPPDLARNIHSCCHMTVSPNRIQAGEKANTVPDRAELILDIRRLPGQTHEDADRHLRDTIGPDLIGSVEIENLFPNAPNYRAVSTTDTPLWSALEDSIRLAYPDARVVPSLITGGTDARFFRERGIPAYGAGLLSHNIPLGEFLSRFHGHNERIDIDSLQLTTQLWLDLVDRLWT
jgi:acetylornithine deacetylase/succinyl-diaminopimelate desuccinylase-like protein